MDLSAFHTREPGAPTAIAWGFAGLAGVRAVAADARCFVGRDALNDAGLTFRVPEDRASVSISMFRLPAGEKALVEAVKGHRHQPWPLPGGAPFTPQVLAPRHVPAHWRHSAIQMTGQDGGHNTVAIKHAWRGDNCGLVIAYSLGRGAVTSYPLFKWVADTLRVVPGEWRLAPPVPLDRRADDGLRGPDDMSDGHGPAADHHDDEVAGPDDVGSGARTRDRPLQQDEQDQLFANILRGWDFLKLPENAPAEEAVDAVRQVIEDARAYSHAFKPNVRHNMTVSFGSVWGHMVCREAGWEWCSLSYRGSDEFLAIVSPDRACFVSPVGFVDEKLDPETDNTILLLFNLIRAGRLPRSQPGAYRVLG